MPLLHRMGFNKERHVIAGTQRNVPWLCETRCAPSKRNCPPQVTHVVFRLVFCRQVQEQLFHVPVEQAREVWLRVKVSTRNTAHICAHKQCAAQAHTLSTGSDNTSQRILALRSNVTKPRSFFPLAVLKSWTFLLQTTTAESIKLLCN